MHQKSALRQRRLQQHYQSFLRHIKKHLSKRVAATAVDAKVVSNHVCNNFGQNINVLNIWKMENNKKILHSNIIRQ